VAFKAESKRERNGIIAAEIGAASDCAARRALRRSCVVEVALGAAVVALVSLFGLLDPN
jgi:putative copper export protein